MCGLDAEYEMNVGRINTAINHATVDDQTCLIYCDEKDPVHTLAKAGKAFSEDHQQIVKNYNRNNGKMILTAG